MMEIKDKALNDIKYIKDSINNTKKNHDLFKKLFIEYGILNLLLIIFTLLYPFVIQNITIYSTVSFFTKSIFYIIIATRIFQISKNSKNNTNIFFRVFISMFFFVTVFMPIFQLIVRFILSYSITDLSIAMANLNQMSQFIMISLFSMSLILVEKLSGKKILLVFGAVNIVIFLVLSSIDAGFMLHSHSYISYVNLYYSSVISLGYIFIGFLSSKNEGVSSTS